MDELQDATPLRVRRITGKGRGVVAARRLRQDEVIERAPVVIIPARERGMIEDSILWDFSFEWGDGRRHDAAIALGRSSLCNHSYTPNAYAHELVRDRIIEFIALRDIEEGEEVTINYNGDPGARDPVGFQVRE